MHKDRITGKNSFLARLKCKAEDLKFLTYHLNFFGIFLVCISYPIPLKSKQLSLFLVIWQQPLGRSVTLSAESQDEPDTELWLYLWPHSKFFVDVFFVVVSALLAPAILAYAR